jgi:hypothetical protein
MKNLSLQQRMKKNLMIKKITLTAILDQHQDHQPEEDDVEVIDDIGIVVVIHHHQVLLIQAHRLIAHVHHQVVHIEDRDVDDQVSFQFFLTKKNEIII